MSLLDVLWKGNSKGPRSTMTMEELLEGYDIEYMEDTPGQQFAVVTPRTGKSQPIPNEMGTASASPFTSFVREEYNQELRGLRGLEKYDKMRKSDGGVKGTLRAIKTPVLAARWFVEPGGESDQDKKAADWVWYNLQNLMSTPWMQTLTEALLMADFGYYMFEKVWENRVVDGQMRTVLKKLGPRHPMDVKQWFLDRNGGPNAVEMYSASTNVFEPDIIIPIEKLLVFTFDKEASNIQGVSVLRSAYKHWYYKEQLYKIDAIQKERHGIGIPIIKLPMGFSVEDKQAAENLGRNIRTNERAHIVLPPGWDLAMLKLEGQPVDCLKSIDHHDEMIRLNILANFLEGNADKSDQDIFYKASKFLADIMCDVFNSYLIPQMTAYNFAFAKPPKLRARRIGEGEDQRTFSFALRNLVGAGVIVPDEQLEAEARRIMDLPPADPETARPQVTPQAADPEEDDGEEDPNKPGGARVGPPRQAPVGRQRNTRGLPARNSGNDQSGGK